MKMKKVVKIIITFLFLIATYNVVSKAAISATSKTVNSGENFSVSVTSNVSVSAYTVKVTGYSGLTFVTSSGGTGAGTTTISDAKATGGMTGLATFQFKAPNVEKDQTFKVSFSASGMGDVNLSTVPDSSCTATITVKAKNQNSGQAENNPSQTGGTSNSTSKSNVATLSNLGIRPNDFSGFSANKTSYSTEVPNNVESIEIYANKGQSGQTITGTGKKTLKEGTNTFSVVVTAEDGKTKKTYTVNVTRKAKDNNNTENETTEETTNETTSEDEVEDPAAQAFGLTKLSIAGVELQPQFQTDVYEYRIELKENLDKLDIEAIATEENANVEITGNENLQDGENVITILVKGDTEDKNVAYQIIVNKSVENQEETNTNKIKNIIIVSTVAVLVLVVIIIVVVSKVKNKKNDAFIPYGGVFEDNDVNENDSFNNYDNNNDSNIEENNDFEEYEEEKPKKKRSKGKRFK